MPGQFSIFIVSTANTIKPVGWNVHLQLVHDTKFSHLQNGEDILILYSVSNKTLYLIQ